MGGLAFASGPDSLYTPRMAPAVYEAVKHRCHKILKQYYTHVGTPTEAPCKKDYGDVDFLVACPTALYLGPNTTATLGTALGAQRSISTKGSSTVSLAIPWPTDIDEEPPNIVSGTAAPAPDRAGAKHVQVDVHICTSAHEWAWMLFHHAHGDLWNMLGSTIRPLGLTANTTGLHIRIEEIEAVDRKKSMVLLTSSPGEVLDFLGLDKAQWQQKFESVQALYEYVAGCKYFWAAVPEEGREREESGGGEIGEDRRALKHNDRKRMSQRPVFRGWVEEFVPACRAAGTYRREAPSREQVRADAFECFGVREEYEHRLEAWRRERQVDQVWRDIIKGGLPTEDVNLELRAAAVRGLKSIILEGDMSSGVVPSKALKNANGFYDIEVVTEFVQDNWRRVGAIQLQKQNIRAVEQMEQKRKEKLSLNG